MDIVDAAEQYDQLLEEFKLFTRKRSSNLKARNVGYLLNLLAEINRQIKDLETTPDNEYGTISAILVDWNRLRQNVLDQLQIKLN